MEQPHRPAADHSFHRPQKLGSYRSKVITLGIRRAGGFEKPSGFWVPLCDSIPHVERGGGGGLMKQLGFFDVEMRLARLSGLGDQIEAFRPDLGKALAYADGSKGDRPSFDPVLMFKILVIQTLNTLSDERTEYLINDRRCS